MWLIQVRLRLRKIEFATFKESITTTTATQLLLLLQQPLMWMIKWQIFFVQKKIVLSFIKINYKMMFILKSTHYHRFNFTNSKSLRKSYQEELKEWNLGEYFCFIFMFNVDVFKYKKLNKSGVKTNRLAQIRYGKSTIGSTRSRIAPLWI